jgi:hypothetical protein
MDPSAASGLAAFGLVWALFLVVLAILWVLVPFAIFGIKPLLREVCDHQKKTNQILATLLAQAEVTQTIPAKAVESPPGVEDTRTLAEIMKGQAKP